MIRGTTRTHVFASIHGANNRPEHRRGNNLQVTESICRLGRKLQNTNQLIISWSNSLAKAFPDATYSHWSRVITIKVMLVGFTETYIVKLAVLLLRRRTSVYTRLLFGAHKQRAARSSVVAGGNHSYWFRFIGDVQRLCEGIADIPTPV